MFDVLGIISLMCASGAAAAAIAFDLGEARASRIWEDRVRKLSERIGEIQRTTVLFAAVDNPGDQHGYFDAIMNAQINHRRSLRHGN